MRKEPIAYTLFFDKTMKALTKGGLLLVSLDEKGKANPMTVGWGTIGSVWGKPMWLVLVRPSRYTYPCIEQTGDFTVNVPPPDLAEAVLHCGTVSGRDEDKLAALGLTASGSRTVNSPVIDQCLIHYECRVVHANDIVPGNLASEIQTGAYTSGDYHRVYWGEILAASADPEAADVL